MSEYTLKIDGREYKATVQELTGDKARIVVNDVEYTVDLVEIGRKTVSAPAMSRPSASAPAPIAAPAPRGSRPSAGEAVLAPLPGLIMDVFAKEGAAIQAGQNLVLMEAMKMENHIRSPYNGTIKKVYVKSGDVVSEGDPLVEIARPAMTTL
jgi:biotin carboxyl carrier protein